MTFLDGASALATVALSGSGQAALSVTGLALGSHAITATYSGMAGSGARRRRDHRVGPPSSHRGRAGAAPGLEGKKNLKASS